MPERLPLTPKRFAQMKNREPKPVRGKLLVSEPSLSDYYFNRSVVLLVEHNQKEGTIGLILNKPLNLKIMDVVKELPDNKFPLFFGGPVHPDRLFYLHTLGDRIEGSVEIINGLYWGGDINSMKKLMDLNLVKCDEIRFFIGYSGWEPNQLDREMKENSWIVIQGDIPMIMSCDPDKLWRNIIKEMGSDYAIWANFPSDPVMN